MLHIILHFAVPLLAAVIFYADRWQKVTLILVATMMVDLDHLLADPIYDPERCSIGFHPLHMIPAILCYTGLFLLPFIPGLKRGVPGEESTAEILHLIGLGLLIHMALDGVNCFL